MTVLKHLRVLEPHPNVLAFYDGRVPEYRFAEGDNWVDGGALSLGIASYAIVSGSAALVYDTHVSVPHASFIRATLAARGVTTITVVLSHWHLDHVAGTQAFADCRIIANRRTDAHLRRRQAAIEAGTDHGPPAIRPLILPNQLFETRTPLRIGALDVELIAANIHSDDATVLWLPSEGVMLAGDTMEDTITYVGEPEQFSVHLSDLDRLAALEPRVILPNHGDPGAIAAGSYGKGLIKAQQQYIRMLRRCADDVDLRAQPLETLIAGPLAMGWVRMFEPYRAIHQQNLDRVLAAVSAG
jgi:cyclase